MCWSGTGSPLCPSVTKGLCQALNLPVTLLSLGMFHTVEEATVLEKVDQGEETPFCIEDDVAFYTHA